MEHILENEMGQLLYVLIHSFVLMRSSVTNKIKRKRKNEKRLVV